MFRTKLVVEKIKTRFVFAYFFFFKSLRLRLKNIVERGRPQMTIWRIACWIPKATNTHSEYVIFIAFPLQQRLHERPSRLRYTYIACLVLISNQKHCWSESQFTSYRVYIQFILYLRLKANTTYVQVFRSYPVHKSRTVCDRFKQFTMGTQRLQ